MCKLCYFNIFQLRTPVSLAPCTTTASRVFAIDLHADYFSFVTRPNPSRVDQKADINRITSSTNITDQTDAFRNTFCKTFRETFRVGEDGDMVDIARRSSERLIVQRAAR